ncbi:MAG TPA: hypothetical protein VI259_11795 [Gemmatimonadaceae bacterium]
MRLSWDGLVVAIAIAGALLFFLRRAWRYVTEARRHDTGCGPSCDCE